MYQWERFVRFIQRKPLIFMILFSLLPIAFVVLSVMSDFSISVDLSKFRNTGSQTTRVYDGMQGAIENDMLLYIFPQRSRLNSSKIFSGTPNFSIPARPPPFQPERGLPHFVSPRQFLDQLLPMTTTIRESFSSNFSTCITSPRMIRMWTFFLKCFFWSNVSRQILTPANIDWIRKFESTLTGNSTSFSSFCMSPVIDKTGAACERPYSIANYFEPIKDLSETPTLARVNAVLSYLAQNGLSWHFASTFNPAKLVSPIIRTQFIFARPYKGFATPVRFSPLIFTFCNMIDSNGDAL